MRPITSSSPFIFFRVAGLKNAKQEFGSLAEEVAAEYLTKNGYRILHRNVRFRQGEIDLVAKEGERIVIVEVKGGVSDPNFSPAMHFDARKQRKLLTLSKLYLSRFYPRQNARIDLIVVQRTGTQFQVDHLQDVIQDSLK